jgi:hypothetical protein
MRSHKQIIFHNSDMKIQNLVFLNCYVTPHVRVFISFVLCYTYLGFIFFIFAAEYFFG